VTPVHAFVVFEHEIAHNTALKNFAKDSFGLAKDCHLSVQNSKHPTTLLWENY
jgi:hypothetical protein